MSVNTSTKYALTLLAGSLPGIYVASEQGSQDQTHVIKSAQVSSRGDTHPLREVSLPTSDLASMDSDLAEIVRSARRDLKSAKATTESALQNVEAAAQNLDLTEGQLAEVETRIPGLIRKGFDLDALTGKLQSERSGLQSSTNSTEGALSTLSERLGVLTSNLKSLQKDSRGKAKEIAKLEKERDELYKKLGIEPIMICPEPWDPHRGPWNGYPDRPDPVRK